jgi:hypothetical protein
MCLVNDAVYIAKYQDGDWTATGAQFAVPYVYKTLFTREPIEFEDMCEAKSVTSALYLDMNEGLPDVTALEKEREKLWKLINDMSKPHDDEMEQACQRVEELRELIDAGHDYKFVGKVGQFCPIKPGCGGGELMRECKDKYGNTKYASATGAKGFRWLESEMVKTLSKEKDIDRSYYDKLVDAAVETISQYGDLEWFISDGPSPKKCPDDLAPWLLPCGDENPTSCFACPHFIDDGHHMNCGRGFDISDVIAKQNKFN